MSATLVFEKQLSDMKLRVTDAEGVRTLWLNETAQSRMLLANPAQLITPYEQVMASWSFFLPTDGRTAQALVLGLGGGSAVKHLCHHYSDWEVTAVEFSDQLAAVAYQYFALPKTAKLSVLVEDAFRLIAKPALLEQSAYDLLLVDLFDTQQQSTYEYERSFWEHCLKLMAKNSVLAINLWADDQAHFKSVLQQLGEVFSWRVLLVPVAAAGNVVVFAFHPDGEKYHLGQLSEKAAKLSVEMALPLTDYLQAMVQQNKPQLDRVMITD